MRIFSLPLFVYLRRIGNKNQQRAFPPTLREVFANSTRFAWNNMAALTSCRNEDPRTNYTSKQNATNHDKTIKQRLQFLHRNVFLRKHPTKQPCVSSGMAISASITATGAAVGGTSPSMVQSAQLRQSLMVYLLCGIITLLQGIHIAHVTSKESVRNYARALFGWDSGSVSVWVLATRVETRPRATIQCPESTWKKCLLHRPEGEAFCRSIRFHCFKFLKAANGLKEYYCRN